MSRFYNPLRNAPIFMLTVLALLAGLTYWLAQVVLLKPVTVDRGQPDYLIEAVNAIRYDAKGLPRFTLHASKLAHFPTTGESELSAPHIVQISPGQADAHIYAARGVWLPDGKTFNLYGPVRIERAAHAGRAAWILETDFLQIWPGDKLAKTNKPVVFTSAGTRLSAQGMTFRQQGEKFDFHGPIKVVYAK